MIGMLFLPMTLIEHSKFVDHHRDHCIVCIGEIVDQSGIESGTRFLVKQLMKYAAFVHNMLAMKNKWHVGIVLENVSLECGHVRGGVVASVVQTHRHAG